MTRFLHTSDWQLGMTRAFLSSDSQGRYSDDQFASIRKLAAIATERACDFVVVAGDVFDSIQPDRKVMARAIDALRDFTVPVFLLPGNHDADSPASFWRTSDILEKMPETIHLIRDSSPIDVAGLNDVHIVGVPWKSRKPGVDLCAEVFKSLDTLPEANVRILVGHGQVDALHPNSDEPTAISLELLEQAVNEGAISYVALGDRHSATEVGDTGAVFYSGAPVATRDTEINPNKALVVEIAASHGINLVNATEVEVGNWQFVTETFDISGSTGIDLVKRFFDEIENKDRTIVKLGIVGTVNLSTNTILERLIDDERDLLAALQYSQRRSELVVVPDDADLSDLDLSGFAQEALNQLSEAARADDENAQVSRQALMLLHRLAGRTQ